MSYVRAQDYKSSYVSPLKGTRTPPALTPTSNTLPKKQHPSDFSPSTYAPNQTLSRQTDRSVSPITVSRRESVNDKVADLMKLNERLREEADYWHRKAIEKDKSLSDQELKKLVQLCEKQALELREYKLQSDLKTRLPTLQAQQLNTTNYDNHFQSMGQELQEQMRNIDEMHVQLAQQSTQIQRLRQSEETYKKELSRRDDEIAQLRKQLQSKERSYSYTPSAMSSQQMDTIQTTHMNQIRVLNDQISSLQQEVVRKVEQFEHLQNEFEQLMMEHRQLEDSEQQMQKQVIEMKEHLSLVQEDKSKEIRFLSQSKDQQLSHMSKMNNDLRLQMSNKMQSLEQTIRDLQVECQRLKNEHTQQSVQLQDANTQIKIYQDQMNQMQKQHDNDLQHHSDHSNQHIDALKQTYQRQLDQLVEEVEKLQMVLADKTTECEQNRQGVDQLTGYLENAEVNENELLKELEMWKIKYEELEQHCQSEIRRIDESNQQYVQEVQSAHDLQIRQLEQQLSSYKSMMEQRMKEVDDQRYQKNDLTKRFNESNTELEQLKNKFFEQQRHYEVEEQVRDEIKRSQQEQLRRQFEVQLDQLENENRNLQFLLNGKTRECEEWKTSYLRGGRNMSTQL